ncbi:hypothetical protein ENUP19_0287G0021 [Entamoeba nuttalli]|uniref:Protein MNN4, putative n=2 Tax=Entamoeba nuttalli TaxID=412467 RepID=K2H2P0_ENTNP|nr:protein MNN4, putative [Entamoeba nuttalli P19]EKE41783.1 protein MNN4, putative [Entamoeba nuttalli P19]|eukprot:XP_008855882.1 protein MNN4, putative [Entamoeba nuttalli P19]
MNKGGLQHVLKENELYKENVKRVIEMYISEILQHNQKVQTTIRKMICGELVEREFDEMKQEKREAEKKKRDEQEETQKKITRIRKLQQEEEKKKRKELLEKEQNKEKEEEKRIKIEKTRDREIAIKMTEELKKIKARENQQSRAFAHYKNEEHQLSLKLKDDVLKKRRIQIGVRLPNGEIKKAVFVKEDQLFTVYNFVQGFGFDGFVFVDGRTHKEINNLEATLEELHFWPSFYLHAVLFNKTDPSYYH